MQTAEIPETYIWDGQYNEVKKLAPLPEYSSYVGVPTEDRGMLIARDAQRDEDIKRTYIVDRAIKQMNTATLVDRQDSGYTEHDLAIANSVQSLLDEIEERKARLMLHEDTLKALANVYRQQDISFESTLPKGTTKTQYMDQWVRWRVQPFQSIHAATDIDKTVTSTDQYLNLIPGSVDAENYMNPDNHGRDTFPLMFVRNWHEPIRDFADTVYRVGQAAPLRPGVREFFQTPDLPIAITSANFRPLVEGVRSQLPQENIHQVYAVEIAKNGQGKELPDQDRYGLSERRSIFATEKNLVVQELSLTHPDRALIYIGDGSSDLTAVDERIAFYFALRGGSFAKQLESLGLPYFEYDDFRDIQQKLVKLDLIQPQAGTIYEELAA